jgi:hypothetical protein
MRTNALHLCADSTTTGKQFWKLLTWICKNEQEDQRKVQNVKQRLCIPVPLFYFFITENYRDIHIFIIIFFVLCQVIR